MDFPEISLDASAEEHKENVFNYLMHLKDTDIEMFQMAIDYMGKEIELDRQRKYKESLNAIITEGLRKVTLNQ